ncbi:uncharacterized protein LDX57_004831 [Aspergillus melleus]|uniref:uncharacterized protein n=1 Tax=Aspergillus melleus TaxID=138277 RepID=UPI001E8E74BD|nr:uncharacterized protein LDX57_004831 [Aspergillus melleus]KAH8427114.1 hypothetical protein LDX57_004831 [Aspergillus melleus]
MAFSLLTNAAAMPSPVTSPGPASPIQTVIVGGPNNDGGFSPPILSVGQGSRVHFDFLAVNHTLTETTFDHPCQKKDGALIDTDFNNANPDNIPNLHPFDYTFASDEARYFYCKQDAGTPDSHCGHGEVFAVNVDQARFEEFRQRAMDTLDE